MVVLAEIEFQPSRVQRGVAHLRPKLRCADQDERVKRESNSTKRSTGGSESGSLKLSTRERAPSMTVIV
jgi:hypothetical protein